MLEIIVYVAVGYFYCRNQTEVNNFIRTIWNDIVNDDIPEEKSSKKKKDGGE